MKLYEAVEVGKKYLIAHKHTIGGTYEITKAIEIMVNTLEYYMETEVEKSLKQIPQKTNRDIRDTEQAGEKFVQNG